MKPFWNPPNKDFHLMVLWDSKYEFEKNDFTTYY